MESVNNFDDWAQVYDIVYNRRLSEDEEDFKFYKDLIGETEGLVLEMACGTGRLYVPFLQEFGSRTHGLDISEKMLEETRSKCRDLNVEPTLFQGDSATVSLDDQYDLIYYPFSSIQNLKTLEEQKSTFENCYNHLAESGKFVFDVPVPSFEYINENYGEIQREYVTKNETEYIVEFWSEISSELDMRCDMTQRVINTNTRKVVFQTTFELTLLPKEQIELLLNTSGFSEYEIYGDFTEETISEEHDKMVFVAEK